MRKKNAEKFGVWQGMLAFFSVVLGILFAGLLLFFTEGNQSARAEPEPQKIVSRKAAPKSPPKEINEPSRPIAEPKKSFDLAEPQFVKSYDVAEPKNSAEEIKISPRVEKPEQIKVAEPQNLAKPTQNSSTRSGRWILIDKSDFTLTLYDGDKVVKSWSVAVGRNAGDKQKKGDNRTPNGVLFSIQQIQDASAWTHDFRDGKGVIKGAYGPWFIRLKTPPWTGIGIHGTHAPESIGTRASEGCIRLNNNGIAELKGLVKLGMTVEIRE